MNFPYVFNLKLFNHLSNILFQFCAEFRRFSVDRSASPKFEEFEKLLANLHGLKGEEIVICYTDPEGDLLPINNNDNYTRALITAKPILRTLVQRKG